MGDIRPRLSPAPWTVTPFYGRDKIYDAAGKHVGARRPRKGACNGPAMAAVHELIETLEFYAGWGIDGPDHDEAVAEDGGERARALLTKISAQMEEGE